MAQLLDTLRHHALFAGRLRAATAAQVVVTKHAEPDTTRSTGSAEMASTATPLHMGARGS
jgi:hypothetical protein